LTTEWFGYFFTSLHFTSLHFTSLFVVAFGLSFYLCLVGESKGVTPFFVEYILLFVFFWSFEGGWMDKLHLGGVLLFFFVGLF
jgi:hypothetical protein